MPGGARRDLRRVGDGEDLRGRRQPRQALPHRIGARAAAHVQLAVVEDVPPEATLEIAVAAPPGSEGVIVLDFGLVEI